MVAAPEYETRPEIKLQQRRAWMVFTAGALIMPIYFIFGGLISSDAAHSAQNTPSSDWLNQFGAWVIIVSFLGCVGTPIVFADTMPRKVTLAVYATIFYFVDLVVSMVACVAIVGMD